MSAGASFVVSPGLSREVVDRCRHHAIPVLPGAITPTEIMAGIDMGLDTFKFFPAGTFGGAATIASLEGPFPHLRFVPTGGSSRTTSQISSPAPIFLPSEVPGSPRLMPSPPGTATPSPT
ncbi:4-hydroxy-2-oxoglutarate aldolase [Cutibacterium acnes JCM 18916]|nr:4-hydroxy-2-oxoglutarate aldolase [Cutibacterium acnes JCM 18916]